MLREALSADLVLSSDTESAASASVGVDHAIGIGSRVALS